MNNELEKNVNEESVQDTSAEPVKPAEESASQYRWKPETSEEARWQAEPPKAQQYTPAPKKKKKHTGRRMVALALVCAILGGICGAGGTLWGMYLLGGNGESGPTNLSGVLQGLRENTTIKIENIDTSKIMTPAEVYALNVNSTVGVVATTSNNWGQTTGGSSGSGFILSQDGYILTNHHVIDGAHKISVSLYSGKKYSAKLIGFDESNDIAVLKIDAANLSPVILGDSDNMNVGDSVVAIGNPLGELAFSLTAGYLSAKDRRITVSTGITMTLMQTDCAINSGNSGGALFNLYGEVVGITNAKYSGSSSSASIDNLGFAIPMNQVKERVFSIIEKGYFAKPYIGVTVTSVSEELQNYGLPKGAAIKEVTPDSPAQAGGLQVGDIVTAVGGEAIENHNEFVAKIGVAKIGESVVLTVYRRGTTIELTIVVGEQIQSATGQ